MPPPKSRRPPAKALNALASLVPMLAAILTLACGGGDEPGQESAIAVAAGPTRFRAATFNLEDVRTEDLERQENPKLELVADLIRRLRPDLLLLNELTYDRADLEGLGEQTPRSRTGGSGRNAQRLIDRYLSTPGEDGEPPLRYQAYMAPSNTGEASGFDLDNDGRTVTRWPATKSSDERGLPPPQTAPGRSYGGDSWGFGTFPGQYAMALLVRDDWQILADRVRSWRMFPWRQMPDAMIPRDVASNRPWYDEQEWRRFRLSSKSHWAVPVRTPGGETLHVLASHPTPPSFDGAERRNKLRNHDEVRLLAEVLRDAPFLVDDQGRSGGLQAGDSFIILGDLNADANEGGSIQGTIEQLLEHPRVQGEFVPRARRQIEGLDPDDTSRFGLRVDYVLPSSDLRILDGAIEAPRTLPDGTPVSDHLMVWLDLELPAR